MQIDRSSGTVLDFKAWSASTWSVVAWSAKAWRATQSKKKCNERFRVFRLFSKAAMRACRHDVGRVETRPFHTHIM